MAIVGFVLASFIVTRINAENFKRIIQVICLLASVLGYKIHLFLKICFLFIAAIHKKSF